MVSDAMNHFRSNNCERSFLILEEAFQLPWEDIMKESPESSKTVLLALKLWFRSHQTPLCADEITHALELFPDEVDFWRHLVDCLGSDDNVKANALAAKAAWGVLNSKVLVPERLPVLAKALHRLGDLEAAIQICPDCSVSTAEDCEELGKTDVANPVLNDCRLSIVEAIPNSYVQLLLSQYDLFSGNSNRSKMESLFAPLTVVLLKDNLNASSQTESLMQSSQDTSQINSPAKKKRPVRQIVRRRSQDLEKAATSKHSIVDILNEFMPQVVGDFLDSFGIQQFKQHLNLMNEQRYCFIDRLKYLLKESFLISFDKLKRLYEVAIKDIQIDDPELVWKFRNLFSISATESVALQFLTASQQKAYLQEIKSRICDDIPSEHLRSVEDYRTKLLEINRLPDISKAKSLLNSLDYVSILEDQWVEGELKNLTVEAVCKCDPEAIQGIFSAYSAEFWFPVASCLPHATTISAKLSAYLLLSDPDLPVSILTWHIVREIEESVDKVLDFLDQSARLLSDEGWFVDKILVQFQARIDIVWNLLRVMYRLPSAISIDHKYSCDSSFKRQPPLHHLSLLCRTVTDIWDDRASGRELNVPEASELLQWILEQLGLDRVTRRLADLNSVLLKESFAVYTRNILELAAPRRRELPESPELQVQLAALRLLYEMQSEQFCTKRRSPEWLQSFKSTCKMHWCYIGDQRIFTDLGLIFHSLLKYSISSFEVPLISQLYGKLKRKLKKALYCFEWSGAPIVERLEVFEIVLQPGLFQIAIEDGIVRDALVKKYVELLHAALESDQRNWRNWYLLAEAMKPVNPDAAVKPIQYAIMHCKKDDLEGQALVYALYHLVQPAEPIYSELDRSHRLLYSICSVSSSEEEKERILQTLLPFLAKPRVSGLATIKASHCDRLGDPIYLQQVYLMAAIDFYAQSPSTLLQVAQRIRTCGGGYLINPDSCILEIAERISNGAVEKEDKKKLLTLIKDMPKSDRLQSVMKTLNN